MLSRFAITEFDGGTQGFNEEIIDLIEFVRLFFQCFNLFSNQLFQVGFMHEQLDNVGDTSFDDFGIERFVDDIRNPELISLKGRPVRIFGSNQYDRDLFDQFPVCHFLQDFKTIHYRHDNIEQYHHDLIDIFFKNIEGFPAVLGFQDMVDIAEKFGQNSPVQFDIINNQNGLFIHQNIQLV